MGASSNGDSLHKDSKGCDRRKYSNKIFLHELCIKISSLYCFNQFIALYGVPLQPADLEYPERGRQDKALQQHP